MQDRVPSAPCIYYTRPSGGFNSGFFDSERCCFGELRINPFIQSRGFCMYSSFNF